MGESVHHEGDVLAHGEVRHAGLPQPRQENVCIQFYRRTLRLGVRLLVGGG